MSDNPEQLALEEIRCKRQSAHAWRQSKLAPRYETCAFCKATRDKQTGRIYTDGK